MSNESLKDLRVKIDAIDQQMMELFRQRMELAGDVAVIKRDNNISLIDPAREAEVVASAIAQTGEELKGETTAFVRSLMGLSKSCQRKVLYNDADEYFFPDPQTPVAESLTVAYQGLPGAWCEQAAMQLFSSPALNAMETFEDVFIAVKDRKASYGVVPIENSRTGGIGEVYDLLRKYGCYIVGQTWVSIHHCLMAVPGTKLEDVREVYSHPQGFLQCRNFLRGRAWDLTACRNTSVGAELVAQKQEKRCAAIGSRRAAQLNGLAVLAPDIATDEHNKTRFIVIADHPEYTAASDTVSVIFRTAHRSGALCDVLFPLMAEGINMKRLESRPVADSRYIFFCDLAGNINDDSMKAALRQAASCCGFLEVLGCYSEVSEQR